MKKFICLAQRTSLRLVTTEHNQSEDFPTIEDAKRLFMEHYGKDLVEVRWWTQLRCPGCSEPLCTRAPTGRRYSPCKWNNDLVSMHE